MKKNMYRILCSGLLVAAVISCKKESSTISIAPPPAGPVVKAGFTVEKITAYAPLKIQLHNTSQDADSYQWSTGENEQNSTALEPVFRFGRKGTYLIKLVALKGTVKDSIIQQVTVQNDPAMKGMFPFSGNWNDSSDYNNDIYQGSGLLAYEPDRKNLPRSCINLGSMGGTVFLPDNLLQNTGTAATISMWFKASTLTRIPLLGLWQGNSPITVNTPCIYFDDNHTLHMKFPTATVAPQITVDGVQANVWNHLVLTASGNIQKAYLNGVLVGTMNAPAINYGTLNVAALGYMYTPANCPWPGLPGTTWNAINYKGWMDDVRIYDRMLTDAEVTALYEE